MASWMVHLRITDKLIEKIPKLTPVEFVVGNIAPDSGVPNEDWSTFTPNTTISHFKTDGKNAEPSAFARKYFTPEQRADYNEQQYSFYLGYLTHLITDVLWVFPYELEKWCYAKSDERKLLRHPHHQRIYIFPVF